MLTRPQARLLRFIDKEIRTSAGVCPSYDEMKDALGLASKSGIHRLITSLEERGFIHRLSHRARSIEIIRMPNEKFEIKKPDSVHKTIPFLGTLRDINRKLLAANSEQKRAAKPLEESDPEIIEKGKLNYD